MYNVRSVRGRWDSNCSARGTDRFSETIPSTPVWIAFCNRLMGNRIDTSNASTKKTWAEQTL